MTEHFISGLRFVSWMDPGLKKKAGKIMGIQNHKEISIFFFIIINIILVCYFIKNALNSDLWIQSGTFNPF